MNEQEQQALQARGITLPFGYDTICQYIPHRYPFMLIDRVVGIGIDTWIEGYKNVSANEPFFEGHFPQLPIMPGVLMVEALAQLAGILGFVSAGQTTKDGDIYLFAGVDGVRFKRPVVPGDRLDLRVEFLMSKHSVYKFLGKASVDGKIACQCELMVAKSAVAQLKG